jgi:ornithine cyclodeaminase
LERALPYPVAVEALAAGLPEAVPPAPLRTRVAAAAGELLVMPAAGPEGVGVKLVAVAPGNPARGWPLIHGVYILFDATGLRPVALFEGAALTARRTAAVSALATRYMARTDAASLVLFGAGAQARAHLHAMVAVRPIRRVVVVDPDVAAAQRLVDHARSLGLDSAPGDRAAVADAAVVCTCTTSATPVFDGTLLAAGAHDNAIGAYTPQTREVDDALVARARLVVEQRDVALAEAGDLILPFASGAATSDDIRADLGELCRGRRVRDGAMDVTLFKAVGMARSDLIVAAAALAALDRQQA